MALRDRHLEQLTTSDNHEEGSMLTLAKACTALAALAFALAVITHFTGNLMSTQPEAFSRAATNLALLAIALVLVFEPRLPGARA
jgi:hypothetical protein